MWNVHIRGQLGFRLVIIAVAASRGPSGEGDAFAQLLILLLSSWERNQFPSSFTVLHSPTHLRKRQEGKELGVYIRCTHWVHSLLAPKEGVTSS